MSNQDGIPPEDEDFDSRREGGGRWGEGGSRSSGGDDAGVGRSGSDPPQWDGLWNVADVVTGGLGEKAAFWKAACRELWREIRRTRLLRSAPLGVYLTPRARAFVAVPSLSAMVCFTAASMQCDFVAGLVSTLTVLYMLEIACTTELVDED